MTHDTREVGDIITEFEKKFCRRAPQDNTTMQEMERWYSARDWLHHKLQKAREELAGEVRLLVAKHYKTDEFDAVGFLNDLQAELDQDKK